MFEIKINIDLRFLFVLKKTVTYDKNFHRLMIIYEWAVHNKNKDKMTSVVASMQEMSDVGGREPSPPAEPKDEGQNSPTPRRTRVIVAKNEGK